MVDRLHHEIAKQNVADALRAAPGHRVPGATVLPRGYVLRSPLRAAVTRLARGRGAGGGGAPKRRPVLDLRRERSGC